jgi:hypothetical protein
VILKVDDCGHTAVPTAIKTARQIAGRASRPNFNAVAICVFLQAAKSENRAGAEVILGGQEVIPSAR